jgi:hypothetical protein
MTFGFPVALRCPPARGYRLRIVVVTLITMSGCRGGTARAGGPPVAQARVGLIEWEITTTARALAAGPVTLDVTNAGTTVHDLRIKGDRADGQTARLGPGQTATLTIDLAGERRVELWCTVPGHRSQGMDTHLSVAT